MMARAGLAALLLVCLTGVAQAALVNCGTTDQFSRQYLSDPTQVTDPTCTALPKPKTQAERDAQQAQHTLVQQFQQAGNLRYLKVVGGLVVEKTQAEKDQVDAALALEQQAATNYQNELSTQELCNTAALQAISTRMQTRHDTAATQIQTQHDTLDAQIEALTTANLATMKTGLKALNDALALGLNKLNDRETKDVEEVARCLRAARGR
jgi:hypothetical protein